MLASLATSVRAALESVKMLHLCRINRRFEMLLVSAEPEVSQGSCFIWAGSLCAAFFSLQPYWCGSCRRRKVVPEHDLTWRRAG